MSNYKDPDNTEQLIINFKKINDHKEIKEYIENIFPRWFVSWIPTYSSDYGFLQKNWETLCTKSGTTPKFIVLVDHIQFDEDHRLLTSFCDKMTCEGYVVRRKEEFQECGACGKAIPSIVVYNVMKSNKLPIPDIWSDICGGCG